MAEAQGTSGEGSVTVTETEDNTVSPQKSLDVSDSDDLVRMRSAVE